MLYLFNSASRNDYVKNVLNTLSKPNGCINDYQYSIQEGYNFVEEKARREYCKKNEEVLIIYIDVSTTPFSFHPMRMGKFIDCDERTGKIYYNIKLNDYVAAVNVDTFRNDLVSRFPNLLWRTDESKGSTGYFAFRGDAIENDKLYIGEDAWYRSVTRIAATEKMSSYFAIFTKLELRKSSNKIIKIKKRNRHYKIMMNRSYKVIVDFFIHNQQDDPRSYVDIKLIGSPEFYKDANLVNSFGVRQGKAEYKFKTKKNIRYSSFLLDIESRHLNSEKECVIANKPISVKFNRSTWAWILIILTLVLLGIATYINGSSFEELVKEYAVKYENGELSKLNSILYRVGIFLEPFKYVAKFVSSLIVSASTFLLIHMYGKKQD